MISLNYKVLSIFLFFSSFSILHTNPVEVKKILVDTQTISSFNSRVAVISALFLGREFEWGPCGEGIPGSYDEKPLYSFESFDCTTFIESVLALTFTTGNSYQEFLDHLKNIKYSDKNEVSYVNRNHFTSLNWIPNTIQKEYLSDITTVIYPSAPERMKWLDVDDWYAKKISTLKKSDDLQKDEKIASLEMKSDNKKTSNLARVSYIPLTELLSNEVQKKLIDEGVVLFNMVKNEHTKVNIPVIIGHQGFIIEKNGSLIIRHASSSKTDGGIVDVLLNEYVETRLKDTTWPTLGFNIMRIGN